MWKSEPTLRINIFKPGNPRCSVDHGSQLSRERLIAQQARMEEEEEG
jgi:hypothetical protein